MGVTGSGVDAGCGVDAGLGVAVGSPVGVSLGGGVTPVSGGNAMISVCSAAAAARVRKTTGGEGKNGRATRDESERRVVVVVGTPIKVRALV